MLLQIAAVQGCVFIFFALLESLYPLRNYTKPQYFHAWWGALAVFSLVWMRGYIYYWSDIPSLFVVNGDPLIVGVCFYLLYSFGNYWIHRFKHSNRILWRYFHRLHHSAPHMETAIAFYRHPIEIALNTIYLIVLAKLIFGLSIEAVCVTLAVEGCLECFHHSNIRTPRCLRWISHIFQIPEMHVVHHELGLHAGNYSPFLWDTVFGTAILPDEWDKDLGFRDSYDVTSYIFLKK